MMQAIILAGGLGTRLRPLTYEIPKVLVPIFNRPFLHYILSMLSENKICDIVVCAGHLGDQIVKSVGDGDRFKCSIKYSFEKELLDTGGAIKNAESLLSDEFLVLNGDTYHPIDYNELCRYWKERRNEYDALIVGYNNKETIVPNNMQVNVDGSVKEYSKKKLPRGNCFDSGVQIFKKVVFKNIPMNKRVSLERDIYRSIVERKRMLSYMTSTRYYDIGTPERIRAFENYIKSKNSM